jgi:putative cell wall-binding protein
MGVDTVTIVGGTAAISSDVFTAIEALDKTKCGGAADTGKVNVDTRYGGGNRYDTARIISTTGAVGTFDASGACDPVKTAIVASGENYPDALAAGALAASTVARACGNDTNIPIVLTEPGSLRTEAAEALGTIKPKSIIVVGGTTAISDATKTALAGVAGVDTVTRIAGTTRYETAADLADVLTDPALGNFGDRFFVASGGNFPDALAAGYWAGDVGGAILLSPTASLGADASSRIKAADGSPAGTLEILHATLLGGTVALSNTVGADTGTAFLSRN